MKHVIGVNFGHGIPGRTKYPDVTEADNVGFQFLVEVRYFLIRVWRCDFAENSPENYFKAFIRNLRTARFFIDLE